MSHVAAENEEALRAWDGVLFERFVRFRDVIVAGLARHGEEALVREPPREGDRVLDVGCGFGDSSALLAELVGPRGSVLGVDVAPRFVAAAQAEYSAPNVRFEVCDVQRAEFAETFDYAFSRFGTMFFASPVAALRNVRRALVPEGRLCMVVWRKREDNPWMHRAETVVKPLVPENEETDEARCGPGPFSMASADTVSLQLQSAGFERVRLERCDLPYLMGRDLEEAVALTMSLGPAAEAIRLAGEKADPLKEMLADLLRDALRDYETADGVIASSSTWIVTAQVPERSSSSSSSW
ncbi:MAG TPA: class I SAM-dependent methyltransferase [Gaiellaceae bacterium]|nr:class I SAM-dependent methyltransferase [Gaiellaceae bacterium]